MMAVFEPFGKAGVESFVIRLIERLIEFIPLRRARIVLNDRPAAAGMTFPFKPF